MKNFVPLSVALAVMATPAQASDFELYGQVNKGVFGFSDGESSEVVVVDNNFSSTRFGLKGKEKLDNGLTASFLLEGEMIDNGSNAFVQRAGGTTDTTPVNGGNGVFTSRHANVGLNGPFGGLYIGKLSTAVDGVLTQDIAGATDIMTAEYRRAGGGLRFRTAGAGLTGFTINNLTEAQANSRTNGVRYETPSFGGFTGKAAIAQQGDLDMAVYYAGKFLGFKAKAGAGMHFNNDAATGANTVDTKFLGSASLKHDSGIGGTLAYSKGNLANRTANADAPESLYGKVGYAWSDYEVAVDAGRSDHFGSAVLADNRLSAYGLGAQYNIVDGVSLSGLYRIFEADVTGVAVQEDVHLYGVAMKVKF